MTMEQLIEKCITENSSFKGNNITFDKSSYYYNARLGDNYLQSGIFYSDGPFFFKIMENDRAKSEYVGLSNKLILLNKPKFIEKLLLTKEKSLFLYHYYEAFDNNSFSYLYNKYRSENDIINFLKKFRNEQINLWNKNLEYKSFNSDAPCNKFYQGRIFNDRSFSYYGDDMQKLFTDMKNYVSDKNVEGIYDSLEKLSKREIQNIPFSETHGDLHNFNFSHELVYWDFEASGSNPISADVAIYLYHSFALETDFLKKYSPGSYNQVNMYNTELSDKVSNILYKEVGVYFLNYLESIYVDNCINWQLDLFYRLFCRLTLIDNILLYNEIDKKLVYNLINKIFLWQKEELTAKDFPISNFPCFIY